MYVTVNLKFGRMTYKFGGNDSWDRTVLEMPLKSPPSRRSNTAYVPEWKRYKISISLGITAFVNVSHFRWFFETFLLKHRCEGAAICENIPIYVFKIEK